eukprot:6103154-Lingulodinium_polyedra.AAC.1
MDLVRRLGEIPSLNGSELSMLSARLLPSLVHVRQNTPGIDQALAFMEALVRLKLHSPLPPE